MARRSIESLIEQGKASGMLYEREITDVMEEHEYNVEQIEEV